MDKTNKVTMLLFLTLPLLIVAVCMTTVYATGKYVSKCENIIHTNMDDL